MGEVDRLAEGIVGGEQRLEEMHVRVLPPRPRRRDGFLEAGLRMAQPRVDVVDERTGVCAHGLGADDGRGCREGEEHEGWS